MIAAVVPPPLLPGHGIRLCAHHGLQSLVLSKTLLAVALAVYDVPGGIHSNPAGYLSLDRPCCLPALAVVSSR
jgi:hypothetical protein